MLCVVCTGRAEDSAVCTGRAEDYTPVDATSNHSHPVDRRGWPLMLSAITRYIFNNRRQLIVYCE